MADDTPVFERAAVASPHTLASEAGRAVLTEGGNALEAVIATAACLAVVYPHMNGLGGDNFLTFRTADGRVRSILAAGAAGREATVERYRAAGYDSIPARGPMGSLTVPGAVAGWMAALDCARALGGRLPLRIILEPAIVAARDGAAVSRSEARYPLREAAELMAMPAFASTFFVDGRPPAAGTLRRQPALAATLEQLAHAGLDDFYRGDVAREIARDLAEAGCPILRDDLAETHAVVAPPLTLALPGVRLHAPPPPSQGFGLLAMLGMLARQPLPRREDDIVVHRVIETVKRANRLRDQVVAEPARVPHDPQAWLADEQLAREAAPISGDRAGPWPPPPAADGGTVWAGAIDGAGLAVSLIQSLFWDYGSGVVLPRTGILMQNRGMAFSLDPLDLRALAPGRRPFHSLHAPLAVFQDGRLMPFGSMGGEAQTQITAQLFLRHHHLGQGLRSALATPRYVFSRPHAAPEPTVKAEAALDPAIVARLTQRGHRVEVAPPEALDSFGHAGALLGRPGGRIAADHDTRADGGAAGL